MLLRVFIYLMQGGWLKMKIGIYVYDNVEELDFIGPFEVFNYVNKIRKDTAEVILLSRGDKEIKAFNGLRFHSDKLITDINTEDLDILIIPGGKGRVQEAESKEIINFINDALPNLKLLASVCTGAFFLGEAGLLTGMKAITHKNSLEELKNKYDVEIVNEKIVKNDKIWLSAGVSSGIDLSLEIVKEFYGKEMMEKIQEGIEYKG
ncbi:MAG: DJ-1/PfpI family protein [Clostridia bacterium]|nr:DJ-1/PfpI family protein [Clostridia bacterium]